jgi:hypothetical protein
MNDLEITLWCARSVDAESPVGWKRAFQPTVTPLPYWPLTNDEQCFDLIKRFRLNIGQLSGGCKVFTQFGPDNEVVKVYEADDDDLNRAVCKCVAEMRMGMEEDDLNKDR